MAAVERARGRAAAVEEQRTRELAAEKKLYDETIKLERQQAIGNQLTLEQVDVLDQEHRARVATINAKANADAKAATAEATQSLAALRIDSAEKTATSLLTIERTLNQARLATQQITEEEFINREQAAAEEQRRIAAEALLQRIEAEQGLYDPERQAAFREESLDIDRKYNERVAELEAQRIEARKRAADTEREILQTLRDLETSAYGTAMQQQLVQLAIAEENLVRRLEESGHLEYIDRVRAAYAAMREEVVYGAVDVGQAIGTALDNAFEGITLGTRKMSDVSKAFAEDMERSFAQWISKSLQAKLGFDLKLRGNFFDVIPGYARAGAEKVGNIWANLWDLLSGGTGVGPRVSASDSGGSFTGSFGGLVSSILGGGDFLGV